MGTSMCKWRKKAQSATQLYTYPVFLWRVPIILTTNNWEYSDFNDADKNWIETNCVAVYIGTKVWQDVDDTPSTPPRDRHKENKKKRVWRSPAFSPSSSVSAHVRDVYDLYGT